MLPVTAALMIVWVIRCVVMPGPAHINAQPGMVISMDSGMRHMGRAMDTRDAVAVRTVAVRMRGPGRKKRGKQDKHRESNGAKPFAADWCGR